MNLAVLVGIVAIGVAYLFLMKRADLPPNVLGHPAMSLPNILKPEIGQKLNEILREMQEYPTNINADLKTGYSGCKEDIGEGQPLKADGTCSHPYLVPNMNHTQCIFPQRIDVGRHFMMTGGPDAIRESVADMTSRVQSFARYLTGSAFEKYPILGELFNAKEFVDAAKAICPKDQQELDTFQTTFLLQIPGQTVATHLDAPYFWGADRCNVPQWLLASMKFSGLFDKLFINQVQVVSYLHTWSPEQLQSQWNREGGYKKVGGDFVYYPTADGFTQSLSAEPLSGNLVDGSKTVHAATVYMPHRKAPKINKDKNAVLRYIGQEQWQLVDEDGVLGNYTSNELRISLVYRARCFKNAEEKQRFKTFPRVEVNDILAVFKDDLLSRGFLSDERAQSISKFDLGLLIMDTYLKYPLPSTKEAWMPYNYCAAEALVPAAFRPLLRVLCA